MLGRRALGLGLLALCNLALPGCPASPSVSGAPEKGESPQASAQPAPLAVLPPTTSTTTLASATDGGPPPTPLRGDEELSPDPLTRDSQGYTLSAALRLSDLAGPPRANEVNAAGLEAARKATELRIDLDLSPSRMRVVLRGRGFVLPEDTELRARADRYGHVVVWPGAAWYRPLAPGSLRAVLGERRLDVGPLSAAEVRPREESSRRIGIRAHKVEVTTRAARGVFEIGRLEGAGEGGVLVCRLLLDLINAPPTAGPCGPDEVPVRAELRWAQGRGALVFELTGALRRSDLPVASLLVPPSTAAFAPTPLPTAGVATMLHPQELAALRSGDGDVPPAPPGAPADGLGLANPTDELRLLFLDGVPVAWAAPGARGEVRGLRRGRYVAQWRTFLGDSVAAPVPQPVPGLAQAASALVQAGPRPDAGP